MELLALAFVSAVIVVPAVAFEPVELAVAAVDVVVLMQCFVGGCVVELVQFCSATT